MRRKADQDAAPRSAVSCRATWRSEKSRAFFRLGIFLPRLRGKRRVDLGDRRCRARSCVGFGQDAAPGIDDQRMAEGFAAVLMLAALRGGDHERAVLDGAGAQQHVPVRLAGLPGEGGGHGQHIGAGQRLGAEKLREAQIVADGEAEPADRQCRRRPPRCPARRRRIRASSRHCRDRRRTCGSCRRWRSARRRARTGSARLASLPSARRIAVEPICRIDAEFAREPRRGRGDEVACPRW